MADSITFYAVRDKNSAGNSSLNLDSTDLLSFVFRSGPGGVGGDLSLEYVADDADADTLPEFDPDTKIVIGGVEYNFAVMLTGTLPTTNPGATKVPNLLEGKVGMLIKIDLNGNGLDANDPQYFFTLDGSGNPIIVGPWGNGACQLDNVLLPPPPNPVCFCAGTDIATPSGLRRVESLRPGDAVLTEDGRIVQIAWVGHSTYSAKALARDPSLRPVRIPANAFGPGLPARDLDVSPQHRIVVDGADCELLFGTPRSFVIARHLLGAIAHTPEIEGSVTYVHLLLDTHEIVIGNGLPSESFQPARRMLELMTGENRDRLMAALDVLGADAMLTRPDALTTLSSREARVFLDGLAPDIRPAVGRVGADSHPN